MEQIIPFNPANGGTTPNLCLSNVSKGYGIPNKYSSAWEAWEHTQQHTDPVPQGLAVPIYYSYTTTIDGVTANYGHINVQLPNGTVWSDGNIYSSIADYESNHAPRFVGWGESVNDSQILKEVQMVTIAQIQDVGRSYFWEPDENYLKVWAGTDSFQNMWYDLSSQPAVKAAMAEHFQNPVPLTVVINGIPYVAA